MSSEGSQRTQADEIRAYSYRTFVIPAVAARQSSLSIRAGDVMSALQLPNNAPNVCSALGGQKFLEGAGLQLSSQDGPPQSTTTTFHYTRAPNLPFDVPRAAALLRFLVGEAANDTDKMLSFALADLREIAMQKDIATVQLWFELEGEAPTVGTSRIYEAREGRHSNLPPRLSPRLTSSGAAARRSGRVISVRPASEADLVALIDWYQGKSARLNRVQLEQMKSEFLARYPDFKGFGVSQDGGGYALEERTYKDNLIGKAKAAIADTGGAPGDVGGRIFDILTSKESGLLGWRSDGRIKQIRAQNPDILETALGELILSHAPLGGAIAEFVEKCWPFLNADSTNPYADTRGIPSMSLALCRPGDAIGVNTSPMWSAAKRLLGHSVFGENPLKAEEYDAILDLSHSIMAVMRDDWDWQPRDLWDVQGFLYAISRTDPLPAADSANDMKGEEAAMGPTNLILYGPPGTGKTFQTAARAVELVDGPKDRSYAEIKNMYAKLMESGQIRFVTFHQSYAYEDFVEGLRPAVGGEEDGVQSAGFRLEARDGIFREISKLAEQARHSAKQGRGFDLNGRQFFKMSLGRAGSEDHIYDAAIDGEYIVLGYGGEVDWADPAYDDYQAVFDKWNEIEPGTKGNSGNIAQVWRFRGSMQTGDIVIVSEGNSKFRAIGEITGPYVYDPTSTQTYNHRRPVRWLVVLDEALPIEAIYDGMLTMQSCYLLKESRIKKEALARLLPGPEGGQTARPDQFVLIVDEINRANISKVFGELITLLEPDKRLGGKHELKVKLPYSGDTFGVPDNLHVIGTMNTADRSIALLDTALRRRFLFEEIMPNPDLLPTDVDGINVAALLHALNRRIEYLFDRDHQIGHAYFWGCASKVDIDRVMRAKIIPLLSEYFYEDWERVRQVLGDKKDDGNFIVRKPLTLPGADDDEFSAERYRYDIRDAFPIEAYAQFSA